MSLCVAQILSLFAALGRQLTLFRQTTASSANRKLLFFSEISLFHSRRDSSCVCQDQFSHSLLCLATSSSSRFLFLEIERFCGSSTQKKTRENRWLLCFHRWGFCINPFAPINWRRTSCAPTNARNCLIQHRKLKAIAGEKCAVARSCFTCVLWAALTPWRHRALFSFGSARKYHCRVKIRGEFADTIN